MATSASRRGVAVAVLVAWAVRSAVQVPVWDDTRSLFTHGLAVNPDSFVSCDMLGYAQGERADAIRAGRPTVPATDPRYAEWRADLERSLAWYDESLRRFPGYVPSLVNVAINGGRLGDHARVRTSLRRVADLQPTLPEAMKMDPLRLGQWMIDSGDPAGAAAYLGGVVRREPGNVPAMMMRAAAESAAGGVGERPRVTPAGGSGPG